MSGLARRLRAAASAVVATARRGRGPRPPQRDDLYRVLFEESTDAMATYSLEGKILTANRALERLVGHPRADLIGRHYAYIVPAASYALIDDRARRAQAGERFSPVFENEIRHRDGRHVPVETRMQLVADGRGGRIAISSARDISARKDVERALRESEERYRRLFVEAEESRRMLNRLYSVGLRMQTSRALDDQVRAFVEGAHDVLGFDRVYVTLASADGTRLEPVGAHGFPADAVSLPITPAAGPFYQAFTSREAVVALTDEDLARIAPMDPVYQAHPQFRGTRFVLVPLRAGDRSIGVVGADNKPSRRPLSPATVEGLSLLGQQLAAVIEEARRHAEARAREREATKLSEITSELASSLDVDRALDLIEQKALELLGCDASGLLRYDEKRGGLVFVRGANLPEAVKRDTIIRPGEGVSGRAFQERAPVWTRDLHALAAETHYADAATDRMTRTISPRAFAAAPIIGRDGIFGVMAVAYFTARDFSPAEIQLLSTLSSQAAIVLDNARTHQETERRRREAEALAEVARAVTQSLDPEEVGRQIAVSIKDLLGARGAIGFRLDPDAKRLVIAHTAGRADGFEKNAAVAWRTGVGFAVREGRSIVSADVLGDARFTYPSLARVNLERVGLRAWVFVPLVMQDRVLGALGVADGAGRLFTADEVRLLEAFGVQAAIAMNNARLFGEIETKHQQLEIANRHKSQFLANMSHELRTPLNAVLGYTEMITDGIYGEVPGKVHETLQRVDRSGRHLLGLINDVLDLSRIEAGQLALAIEDYSMNELVATVARTAEPLAAARRLAFTTRIAPRLPRARGDERRLTQVLLNLVGNAIKFTETGTVGIEVEVDGDDFHVAVRDTGPGIAHADQQRIFEEFQQAEGSSTRRHGGAGLGLAISRRIVALHAGRIWLESAPGQGSVFHVTVPIRVGAPGQPG